VRQSNALRSIFKPIKTRHILLPTANPAPLASGTYANRHESLAGNAVSKDCCAVNPSAYRCWTILFCAPHGASHEIHRHSPTRANHFHEKLDIFKAQISEGGPLADDRVKRLRDAVSAAEGNLGLAQFRFWALRSSSI
jgi:hypothetical protein